MSYWDDDAMIIDVIGNRGDIPTVKEIQENSPNDYYEFFLIENKLIQFA